MRYSYVTQEFGALKVPHTHNMRMAKCVGCGNLVPSSEDLPCYRFRSKKLLDFYDCGCDSWEVAIVEDDRRKALDTLQRTQKENICKDCGSWQHFTSKNS